MNNGLVSSQLTKESPINIPNGCWSF